MATVISYKTRKAFLDEIAKGYSDSRAARQSGTTVKQMQKLAEEDGNFKEDWDDAIKQGLNRLEDKAHQRAMQGSDTLMMFLLKARDRAKYGDQVKTELSGQVNLEGSKTKLLARLDSLIKRDRERAAEGQAD